MSTPASTRFTAVAGAFFYLQATSLYINFINMFTALLNLMGDRR